MCRGRTWGRQAVRQGASSTCSHRGPHGVATRVSTPRGLPYEVRLPLRPAQGARAGGLGGRGESAPAPGAGTWCCVCRAPGGGGPGVLVGVEGTRAMDRGEWKVVCMSFGGRVKEE